MAEEAKIEDLTPYQILMTALHYHGSDHLVEKTTPERKVWLNAETEGTDDLILLGGKPTTKKAKTVPPIDEGVELEELIDAYMAAVRERWEGLTSAKAKALIRKSRCMAITSMATPEWDGIRSLVEALTESHRFSDAENEGVDVPSEGELIVELWERGREMRRKPGEGPDWHGMVALRGDVELIPYNTKQTFRDGQWISHKKFGPGYVVEAREQVRVLFEESERLLVHIPLPTQKFEAVAEIAARDSKLPSAGLAGIEVTRLPPDPKLSPDYDEDADRGKRRR